MTLSITNIVVTSEGDKVVALDWIYSNAEGQRGNRWELERPYGDTPLKDCTEGVLTNWLSEQWPDNTIADLDRVIAEDKARRELEATESDYKPHTDGPPTPVTQEIDVPDGVGTPGKTKKRK